MSSPRDMQRLTRSEGETMKLGRALAGLLRAGDVVAIDGELGAGKTRLVRGIAEGLGIAPERAHSPTYVLANVYESDAGARLVHVDAYRLVGAADLEELGWDRLDDGASVVVVEWAERLGTDWADADRLIRVRIEHLGPEERRISLSFPAGREAMGLHLES